VLDDGFQHRQLHRDCDIVCVPSAPLEDYPIPAGTLREPLPSLQRADCICMYRSGENTEMTEMLVAQMKRYVGHNRVYPFYYEVCGWIRLGEEQVRERPPDASALLLCAIARPERFEESVQKQGIPVTRKRVFPDHHSFTPHDFRGTLLDGIEMILTTEKDAIRLKRLKLVNKIGIWYLKIIPRFFDSRSQSDFFSAVDNLTFQQGERLCV
jgi:tetraacyldisaccharide 4'-kinase